MSEYFNYFEIAKSISVEELDKKDFFNSIFNDKIQLTANQREVKDKIIRENLLKYSDFKKQRENPNEMFNSYLNNLQNSLSGESFSNFLRFLNLYCTGRISHIVFIRLILPLLQKDDVKYEENELINFLPLFLASIQTGVYCESRAKYNSLAEEYAAELLIYSTSKVKNKKQANTLSLCLKLLSSGIICRQTAFHWLSSFCNNELLERLKSVDDFSVFRPDYFPPEYILCDNFDVSNNFKTIYEELQNSKVTLYNYDSFGPVLDDLILFKLLSTRKLFKSIINKKPFHMEKLSFLYGDFSNTIYSNLPDSASLILNRLSQFYNQNVDLLHSFYRYLIQREDDLNEKRILYNRLYKKTVFLSRYDFIGEYDINICSLDILNHVFSLLEKFINAVFLDSDVNELMTKNLNTTKTFFDEEHEGLIYHGSALKYIVALLSELCALRKEDNTPDEEIIDLIKAQRLQEKNTPMRNSDFLLIKIASCLHNYGVIELEEYPSGLESTTIYSAVSHIKNEKSISVAIRSFLSPSFLYAVH